MSKVSLTADETAKQAKAAGCYVKHPKDNELFVDIDNESDLLTFEKNVKVLEQHIVVKGWNATPSKSGLPKRHIVVWLDRDVKDNVERILLQAVLGSDRLRELLSYVRIDQGINHNPTVFFEKEETKNEAEF